MTLRQGRLPGLSFLIRALKLKFINMKTKYVFFLLTLLFFISFTSCEDPTTQLEELSTSISVIFSEHRIISNPDLNPDLDWGSVSDIDGNVYKTVQIGAQTWMAENLKTTKYNNGDKITLGYGAPAGFTNWFNLSWYNGAYCWYNNDSKTYNSFGAIYNWYATATGKLCPAGWHVPTDQEWTTLTDYLGGEEAAFSKMRNTGTNESGFTAVQAGELCGWGFIKNEGLWWSATSAQEEEFNAYLRSLWINEVVRAYEPQSYGYTVRCLKD